MKKVQFRLMQLSFWALWKDEEKFCFHVMVGMICSERKGLENYGSVTILRFLNEKL